MNYATEDLIALLRTARVMQGITQRELGERIGSPQSYVARLEAGRTDPKLSSLVEVARALDLDLKLVPRGAVPVVDGALRAHSLGHLPGDVTSRAILASQRFLERLERLPGLDARAAGEIAGLVVELASLRYQAQDLAALQDALRPMERVLEHYEIDGVIPLHWDRRLRETRTQLQALRNSIAHAASATPRPAFGLDDDEA